jgi:hypothetical protein
MLMHDCVRDYSNTDIHMIPERPRGCAAKMRSKGVAIRSRRLKPATTKRAESCGADPNLRCDFGGQIGFSIT